MKHSRALRRMLIALIPLAICGSHQTWAASSYHLLARYAFGAAEGSTREYFNYITVDSEARRAYLSHGTEIIVMDADGGQLVGKITGLKQARGLPSPARLQRDLSPTAARGK